MSQSTSQRSYGDHHRLFLQVLLRRHILKNDEVLQLMKHCCEHAEAVIDTSNPEQVRNFIAAINERIEPVHMRIRKGISEEDGANYYALVSITEIPLSRFASDYTTNELEYFKKLVERIIVASDSGSLSTVQALNLTDTLERKITKNNAEDLLSRLAEDKWITLSGNGDVSLSTRTIIELEPYLKDVYQDLLNICPLCNEIVLKGQSCNGCEVRLHSHCIRHLCKRANQAKCPRCKADWVAG